MTKSDPRKIYLVCALSRLQRPIIIDVHRPPISPVSFSLMSASVLSVEGVSSSSTTSLLESIRLVAGRVIMARFPLNR